MDKFDFMNILTDIFEKCESNEEIESKSIQMINMIKVLESLHKEYLKLKRQ